MNVLVTEELLTILLNGRFVVLVFFALGVISLVFGSIVLQYHWKKYGEGIAAVRFVRPIYYLGVAFIIALLIAAVKPFI